MHKNQHDNAGVGEIVSLMVRAAITLTDELGDARPLFDFQHHNLIDKVSKALEMPEYPNRETEANLELLQELVKVLILQQVLGAETSLQEVYSDSGMIEYEISRTPIYTLKGERLKRLSDALVDFQQWQLELVIRQREAAILAQRFPH
ncbi:hypothetical protein R3X27_04940 [Tropicimonas sp. TH_r6]|uniref:hypothetical protein n=1 Tax=Tropicimonas sp. TH_r6 TaxID=3082085 RepID=UPI00295491ED|nr:hypothetical protein [Tropicimonas sp. TH_r6]MDV7142024.1 hypothetical protein [Tropicimonas sp. TH_r6]